MQCNVHIHVVLKWKIESYGYNYTQKDCCREPDDTTSLTISVIAAMVELQLASYGAAILIC